MRSGVWEKEGVRSENLAPPFAAVAWKSPRTDVGDGGNGNGNGGGQRTNNASLFFPCLLPLLRHSTPLPPKFSSSCPGLFSTLHRPVLSSRSPPAALQNPPPHIDIKGEEEVEMAKRRGKQGRLMGREKSGGGTKSATGGGCSAKALQLGKGEGENRITQIHQSCGRTEKGKKGLLGEGREGVE